MNIIKVNYDNAFIKKPVTITPSFLVFHELVINDDESVTKRLVITVKDNLDKEPFLTNYLFHIYMNDELIGTCDKRSDNTIVLDDLDNLSKPSFVLKIDGYYFNDNGYTYEFIPFETTVYLFNLCSRSTICGTHTFVQKLYSGYLNPENNLMYESYENGEFINEIVEHSNRDFYRDILTNNIYKWNNNSECYMLI